MEKETEEEKALKIVEAGKRKREDDCIEAIKLLMDKYKCQIIIEGQFSGNQFQSGIKITAQ